MKDRLGDIARSLESQQCIHDNNCGDVGGRQSWCAECIEDCLVRVHNEAIDLALGSVQSARECGETDMRQVLEWIEAHKV